MNKSSSTKAGAKITETAKKKLSPFAILGIVAGVVLLVSTVTVAVILLTGNSDSDGPAKRKCPSGQYDFGYGCEPQSGVEKPVLYLYPTEATEVSVQVSHPENFTAEYPKYNNGWRVLAQPNGDLTDLNNNGRELYSLYYESKNIVPATVQKDGFVIKGSDTAAFLEEKLTQLGLNARESEEFIIYWLPQLQDNPYNYIRFQTAEEIDASQALNISPKSDTTIRVWMSYQPLDKPITVQPQKLPKTPIRAGFTVVEWGGTRIGSDIQQ